MYCRQVGGSATGGYSGGCGPELCRETNRDSGSEDQGSEEQEGAIGAGSVAASEGVRADVGVRVRDAGAASGVIFSIRLRGRILVLVGENCKIPNSGVFLKPFFCFGVESLNLGFSLPFIGLDMMLMMSL